MSTDQVDALVIFGATGDLAKLETFPALVGLVDRGVLDVPVIGVAKSGWGLDQFRDYAVASLRLNNMDPQSPAAAKMLGLLRYVDGDLDDVAGQDARYRLGSALIRNVGNIEIGLRLEKFSGQITRCSDTGGGVRHGVRLGARQSNEIRHRFNRK